VSRLSEAKNYRDGPDPAERTVLCAEVPCDEDDDVWRAGDGALAALVGEALECEQLSPPRPVDVVVRRLPSVYPVYQRGWAEEQDALEAWAAAHERLLVLGRQALFAHDNTHHALTMAWAAAASCDRTARSSGTDGTGSGRVSGPTWSSTERPSPRRRDRGLLRVELAVHRRPDPVEIATQPHEAPARVAERIADRHFAVTSALA